MADSLAARAIRWWNRRFGPVVDEEELRYAAAAAACSQQQRQATPTRCEPLRSVSELMAWRPPPRGDERASRVPLVLSDEEAAERASRPRLLVCHDFKG